MKNITGTDWRRLKLQIENIGLLVNKVKEKANAKVPFVVLVLLLRPHNTQS